MAFYKITFNKKHSFATVHNYGCTFRCPVCSYKLRSGKNGRPGRAHPEPERFLDAGEIKEVLRGLPVDNLYFMGGEPTVARDLGEILRFAKEELKVRTSLGHTNGSNLPLPFLDGANVGLKAWDEKLHLELTGFEKKRIFGNVEAAVREGISVKANVVFIPELVGADQVENIAAWLGSLGGNIPFRVTGYIPVPGQPYSPPGKKQMEDAVSRCRRHLAEVSASCLTPREALGLSRSDDLFKVVRVA